MKDHFVGEGQRTPSRLCPYCGALQDTASGLNTHRKPKAGDVSICIHCGGAAIFTADLTARRPTDQEAREIAEDLGVLTAKHAVSLLPKKTKPREEKPS